MIDDNEKLNERELIGLCATCMRRKRCPKAYTYVNLSECGAYKICPTRGKPSTKKNKNSSKDQ